MYVSPINEIVRLQQNLKAAGQQKRGRHPVFNANMFYPRKLENELNDLLRAELERIFLENMAFALNGLGLRDDVAEMNAAPVVLSSGFLEKSKNFAERVNANAGDTYQKQVELIIGRPYYPPTAQREILEAWHDEFQALCISAGQDGKKKIAMTVAVAKEKGWNKKQTEEAIRALLPAETKHRAELIARTETGKLNSRCVRETYAQTGIKYYKWLTTIDGRERENHAAMNGQICDVSDPDVIYEENPENPLRPIQKKKTGEMVHLHPGQDFQCRCTMVMWEPEIDGKYEVTEDHEREEAERLEMEEKTRQEEAERQAREREAEEEKKRQEAEEKARAEMEKKAQQRAEAKYKRELKKAEEAAKKAQEAEARANGATRKAEILQKANERHAKRTEAQAQAIRERWAARHGEFSFITENNDFKKIKDLPAAIDYMKKTYNIDVEEGFKNCDPLKVIDALKGVDSVVRVFPEIAGDFEKIRKVTGKDYVMAAGFGVYRDGRETQFFMNLNYTYIKKKDAEEIGAASTHRNANAYSAAAHEVGHIVNYWIARKIRGRTGSYYEVLAHDWVKQTAEAMAGRQLSYQEIMAEYRAKISLYADHYSDYCETVAEAFGDVFRNRENAQEFSKALFKRIMKEYEAAVKL